MGATLDETRVELAAQRARMRETADRLEGATRRAVDLRAKVRENPAKTVALAAGVAFFLLGGPRRTVALLRDLNRSEDAERAYAGLPASLRALVDASAPGSGQGQAIARHELALAIHAWRADPKNRKKAERLVSETLAPPGPGRAFWAMVEVSAVIVAGLLARGVVAPRLARTLFSTRPPAGAVAPGPAGGAPEPVAAGTQGTVAGSPPASPAKGSYSGWSGQRGSPAGPAKPGSTTEGAGRKA
jgi:hypothetical protein